MAISEYIAANSPIADVVGLLNLHHSNPLGIAPVWQLLFIFVVVMVMEYFMHQIRWHQKPQYYPVLFSLLGVSIVSLYYYCFQTGLPELAGSTGGYYTAICWFCNHEYVGWGWAVTGIIASIAVLYILLCAIQQTCAQLSMYACPELIKTKPWKEWKLGVGVAMLAVVLTFIGLFVDDVVATWLFLVGQLLLVLFVIGKMIADSIRMKNAAWGISNGLVFFIGITPVCIFSTGCVECTYAYIIAILALFTGSKARKKKGAADQQSSK